jgi:hypothetical protein
MKRSPIRDLRPLSERQDELYASELFECIAFVAVTMVVMYGMLSIGGM